ncbi:MAG: hypothetical protein IIT53_10275, partial [Fibrobacter sp.]|nr:hypothetical protein [Fibrobacter sp.]
MNLKPGSAVRGRFSISSRRKFTSTKKKWGKEIDDKCVDRESRPSSLGHDRDQHLGQERSDCQKDSLEAKEDSAGVEVGD